VEVWYWKRTNDDKTYGTIEKGSPTFKYIDGHDEVYGLPSLEYPGMIKVCCQITIITINKKIEKIYSS